MKKRFIYICMFASLLTFSSCNEALDVAPDGRLSLDEVFQDPDLTKAYFSTCFDYLPKKSLRYHFWSNYPVALSDEMCIRDSHTTTISKVITRYAHSTMPILC